MKIRVTQTDIKEAKHNAGEYDKCPVARALIRFGFSKVDVDEGRIILSKGTRNGFRRYLYKTPLAVDLFIDDFDNHRKVEPFDFVIAQPRLAKIDDERKPLTSTSYLGHPAL